MDAVEQEEHGEEASKSQNILSIAAAKKTEAAEATDAEAETITEDIKEAV